MDLLVYVSDPEKVQMIGYLLTLTCYFLILESYKYLLSLTCLRFRPWKGTRISEYLLSHTCLSFWPWKGRNVIEYLHSFVYVSDPEKSYSEMFTEYICFGFGWLMGSSDMSRHTFVVNGFWSSWRFLYWIFYCGCCFPLFCFVMLMFLHFFLLSFSLGTVATGAPRCLRAFSKKTNPRSPRLKKRRGPCFEAHGFIEIIVVNITMNDKQ